MAWSEAARVMGGRKRLFIATSYLTAAAEHAGRDHTVIMGSQSKTGSPFAARWGRSPASFSRISDRSR
jgi:hypothetical protein